MRKGAYYNICVWIGDTRIPCETMEEAEALASRIETDDAVLIEFAQVA